MMKTMPERAPTEFKVLDHGYVRLVDWMGNDLSPLEAARMSTDNPTGVDSDKDDRLRTRLWGDKHTSPFEMNELVVEVQCPMFVLRQMDRHRTATVANAGTYFEDYDEFRKFTNRNEFSGRYSVMPDLYYIPPHERIQKKGKANKQGSAGALDFDHQEMVQYEVKFITGRARESYDNIIGTGCASEIARLVLPQNQYTKIRLKACLLHWLKFFDLRLRGDVQKETRAFAQAIAWITRALWPKCWDVFEEFNLYGAQLSRTDRLILGAIFDENTSSGQEAVDELHKAAEAFGRYSKRQIRALRKKLVGPDDDLMKLLDCTSFVDKAEGESETT